MPLRQLIPRTHIRPTPDTSLAIINIVLLLIFFFLLTGRLASAPGIPVQLSETAELPIAALPKPILVWESETKLTLDGEAIGAEALEAALSDQTQLHILIDRAESARVLIDLLAKPEFAHLSISLVTIHRSSDP